mmetsp:Transcript_115533/g.224810  ORF Transcript_115533/g.224810 Transcript_115533/m.224810 type:complete len:797 (-) Transcript_115533:17-2407(-)
MASAAAPTDSSCGQSSAETSDTVPQQRSDSSTVMSMNSGSSTASAARAGRQSLSSAPELAGQPFHPTPPPLPPALSQSPSAPLARSALSTTIAPQVPPAPATPPAPPAPPGPPGPLPPPTLPVPPTPTLQPASSAPAVPTALPAPIAPTTTAESAAFPVESAQPPPRLPPPPPPLPTQATPAMMVTVPPVPMFTFPAPPPPPPPAPPPAPLPAPPPAPPPAPSQPVSMQPAAASVTASLPEQPLANNLGTSDPTKRTDAVAGDAPASPKMADFSQENPEKGAITDGETNPKRKAQRRGKRGRQKRLRADTDPKPDTSQLGDGQGETADEEHRKIQESRSPKPARAGRGKLEGVRGSRGRGRGRMHLRSDGLVAGPILRHNKSMFSYGNYDPHFRQRHERYASSDPRIEVLLRARGRDFFWSKATLDIGCGAGFVAFLVANLGASRVEGVDIDTQLVSRALKQLRRLKREGHHKLPTASIGPEEGPFPISLVHSRGIIPYSMKPLRLAAVAVAAAESMPLCRDVAPDSVGSVVQPAKPAPEVPDVAGHARLSGTDAGHAKLVEEKTDQRQDKPFLPQFPYNLEFRTANMLISELEEHRQTPFDVILCMKLTKWVHLNWGDDGLKVLFHKCFRLLKPGGILVLEAQEWSSYRDVKHLTPHMRENKNQISLRPQEFVAYLAGVVGFQKPDTVADPSQLKRPLLLFLRPEQPPLHSNRGSTTAATSSVTERCGPLATVPTAATTLGQTASTAQMVAPPEFAGHVVSAAAATMTVGSATAGVAPAGRIPAEGGAVIEPKRP